MRTKSFLVLAQKYEILIARKQERHDKVVKSTDVAIHECTLFFSSFHVLPI